MRPSFILITPALNVSAHIDRALQSVVVQQCENIDVNVIVADGGSRDNTRVQAARFDFVKLLEGADNGIYEGFNRGLAACECKSGCTIIGFLNADDMLPAGALIAVFKKFQRQPDLEMVSGSARFHSEGSDDLVLTNDHRISTESLLFGIPALNTRFFRLGMLRQFDNFATNAGIAADRELLLRLACGQIRSASVSDEVYTYYMHAGSTTLSQDAVSRNRIWKAEIDLANYLNSCPNISEADKHISARAHLLAQVKQAVYNRRLPPMGITDIRALMSACISWKLWHARLAGY